MKEDTSVIRWSAWTPTYDVPTGALDVYQSLQHLVPGACVAAHRHDGPETGLVIDGSITRWQDDQRDRRFVAGDWFVTPACVAHATANMTATNAEQITLHILPRGSAFAHPCSCLGFPEAAPGSTSRIRVCFAVANSRSRWRTRHAVLAINGEVAVPASSGAILRSVLDGDVTIDGRLVHAGDGSYVGEQLATTVHDGFGTMILTAIQASS